MSYNKTLPGTCYFVVLALNSETLRVISWGKEVRPPATVVVVVTVYDTDPGQDAYFEVHPVSEDARRWLGTPTVGDAPMVLYKAIAELFGMGDNWRAKAPSGSGWDVAVRFHGGLGKPIEIGRIE